MAKHEPMAFIDILGKARMRSPANDVVEVSPAPAAVLVRLLLADGRPVPGELLRDVLTGGGSDQAVQTHMSYLRRQLRAWTVPIPGQERQTRTYQFLLDGVQVDAFLFRDAADQLGERPQPKEIDQLLELWRGDPRTVHPTVPERLWRSVFQARDRLLDAVGRLALSQPPPSGWSRFADLFPGDRKVAQTDQLLAADEPRSATAEQRLLIVEDRIGPYLCDRLAPYACTLIKSSRCWQRFLQTTSGALDFNAALVDLHLNDDNDDYGGLDVLAYLRDHAPHVPAALLTAYMKPGIVEDLKEEYRIALIVHKDPSGSLADVRSAVSRLLRHGQVVRGGDTQRPAFPTQWSGVPASGSQTSR
ncbi:hypothetical protein [Nonomuraea sp. NEAU-A123]|uniref:AfsR/SARP family transcriptional regulator n=1 Tax=Nonomuraea sp. NEAU-A123 TaxID=2839649 RepID=UPI001BE48127|nr:hypothetical protein [Nonomuraea sp. NEAU-A123]MBT2234422.1 hypothetical protein [Nonomuraea sp. NEAU-A123]